MKYLIFVGVLVLGTTTTATAQTPTGTPPSGTMGQSGISLNPSGSSGRAKPDATIDTQVNDPGANQANPADSHGKRTRNGHKMKDKGGKSKMKKQANITM